MARTIQNGIPNVDPPDADFLHGRARNNNGANNGTRLNETSMGDIFTFFAKMVQDAGITPNGLPDCDYTGYQFMDALLATPYRRYECYMTQTSTNDPTVIEMPLNNQIGTITWVRTGVGVYTGTISGNYPSMSVQIISGVRGFAKISQTVSNVMEIRTYNTSNAAADGILTDTSVILHLYNN